MGHTFIFIFNRTFCEIPVFIDMEKIKCNSCEVEKDIKSFYKCKECRDGVSKVCKMCKVKGLKSKQSQNKIHQFNKDFRKSDIQHYNLAGCTPNDYGLMWDILEQMGYDCYGDIHQQFLDRMKFKYDVNLKYRNKPHITTFDKDGKFTPRNKKTPTDE